MIFTSTRSLIFLLMRLLVLNVKESESAEDCFEHMNVRDCSTAKEESNLLWNLYYGLNSYFVLEMDESCIGKKFSYDWTLKSLASEKTLHSFKAFATRSILVIPSTMRLMGEMTLQVIISSKRPKKSKKISCLVKFVPGKLKTAMKGATVKYIFNGDLVELDGTASYEAGHTSVAYMWTCESTTNEKCNNFHATGKKTHMRVEGKTGELVQVILTLTAEGDSDGVIRSLEIAEDTAPDIDIICKQNCPAAGNYDYVEDYTTYMEVTCRKNCKQIVTYEWEGPGEAHGPKNSRFTAPGGQGDLDGGPTTSIAAKAMGGKNTSYLLSATWTLNPQTTAEETPCTIEPTEGTALTTLFMLTCDDAASTPLLYKLVQSGQSYDGVPIAVSNNHNLEGRLSADDGKVMVDIITDTLFSSSVVIDVKVKPLLAGRSSKDQIAILLDILVDEATECRSPMVLAKEGRVWEAIQVISGLLTELRLAEQTVELKRYTTEFVPQLLDILLTFPVDSLPDGMVEIISKVTHDTFEKDPGSNLKLSEYCKAMAERRRTELSKAELPFLQEIIVNRQDRIFHKCASYLMDHKVPVKKPKKNATTVSHHSTIPEEYPDYKDVSSSEEISELKDITENAIAIMAISNAIRLYVRVFGARPYRTDTVLLQNDVAKNIERNITLAECHIVLPKYLGVKDYEPIRLMVFLVNKSAFSWDDKSKQIATSMANLRLFKRNMQPIELPQPVNIDVKTGKKFPFIPGNATLPEGVYAFNSTTLPVYRIDAMKGSNLIIEFRKISSALGIKVVMKERKRPVLSDFANVGIIKSSGVIRVNKINADIWFYMGILPATTPITVNKLAKRAIDVTYMTSNDSARGKLPSSDQVTCRCSSIANMAGFSYVPHHRLDKVIKIPIVLTFRWNYIIYVMTAIVFGCFLLALCFVMVRKIPDQQIYYLSDNIRTHEYGYLIMVKTDDDRGSGTTSNVTIKIFGELAKSRAHVLNYPDPDMNFLQMCNYDYFVLATHRHLGNLKGIELWIDCLYMRPQWTCEYIMICDLQTKNWWKFVVETRFSPLVDSHHYVSIRALKKDDKNKVKLFMHDIAHCFHIRFGPSHTWNICARNEDVDLFYAERITIVLSHIVTTYTFALAICAAPEFNNADYIDWGFVTSYVFVLEAVLAVSFLSSLINYSFVILFRFTTRRHRQPYAIKKKPLEHKVKHAIWVVLITLLVVDFLYLTYFSIGISDRTSTVWLAVTTLSLLLAIFVWENLFMGITHVVLIYKSPRMEYDYEGIIRESNRQRAHLRTILPRPFTLRPYLSHLYQPMSHERHMRKRAELKVRIEMAQTFKDMIAFLVYFCLLYTLAGVNIDSMRIFFHGHIEDMFLGLESLDQPELEEISSLEGFFEYLNETVATAIHGHKWYGDYVVVDPGLMADFQTKVVGVARIRQKMVRYVPCPEREFSKTLFNVTRCTPEYSAYYEYTKNLSEYKSIWTYGHDKAINVKLGEMDSYCGGGYTTHLGRTLDNAYYNIDEIFHKNWLSSRTRALFIEFWAYNANRNMFVIVCITLERSATGFIWQDIDVIPYKLMFSDISEEMLIMIVFSVFATIIIYNFVNQIVKIVRERLSYIAKFRNWLDITICVANVTVIVLFIQKEKLVDDLLLTMEASKRSAFVEYFEAIGYCETLIILIAVLICISVIRTWSFLRFGFMFKVFERTMKTQPSPLLGAFIFNVALMLMYISAGFILFSAHSIDYRGVYHSFSFLALMGLDQIPRDYDHEHMATYNPTYGQIYYGSYKFCMLIMINIYITIITMHYEEAREYVSNQLKTYSVANHIKDEYSYFVRYFKRRKKYLKGGEDYHEYKHDGEFLEMPSNRFDLMAAIAFAVVYNAHIRKSPYVICKRDLKVMETVAGWYLQKDGGHDIPYYHDLQPTGKIAFLTTNAMTEMETIADAMLGRPQNVEREDPKVQESKIKPGIMKDTTTLKRIIAIERIMHGLHRIISNIDVVEADVNVL